MGFDTKPNLSNNKFEQLSGETLTLNGITEVHGLLEIENGGNFRVDDGNQQTGYVLTSDVSGNTSWQANPDTYVSGGTLTGTSLVLERTEGFPNINIELSGISTTVGGSDTHIQFNNNGEFSGTSNLTWTESTRQLDVVGDIAISGTSFLSAGDNISNIQLGNNAIINTGLSNSIAIGNSSYGGGISSISLGNGSISSGNCSIAIGTSSCALTDNSIAIGRNSCGGFAASIGVGFGACATGNSSLAFGCNARATGNYSTAFGDNSISQGNNSVSIGNNSSSNGNTALAIANASYSCGDGSIAIGTTAKAYGLRSIAIGGGSCTLLGGSINIAIGSNANTTGSFDAISIGRNASANLRAIAIGCSTCAGSNGVAIGNISNSLGTFSTAIGRSSCSVGQSSVSIGNLANANTTGSISMGSCSQSLGLCGISIGFNTLSCCSNGIVIGQNISGNTQNSLSIGWNNTVAKVEPDILFAKTAEQFINGSGNLIIGSGSTIPTSQGKLHIEGDLYLTNTSTPSTPTSGGVLFVQSGELKYIGSGGTVTTIAVA